MKKIILSAILSCILLFSSNSNSYSQSKCNVVEETKKYNRVICEGINVSVVDNPQYLEKNPKYKLLRFSARLLADSRDNGIVLIITTKSIGGWNFVELEEALLLTRNDKPVPLKVVNSEEEVKEARLYESNFIQIDERLIEPISKASLLKIKMENAVLNLSRLLPQIREMSDKLKHN